VQRFDSLALAPITLDKPVVDESGEYVQVTLGGHVDITPALRARLTDPSAVPAIHVDNEYGTESFGGSFDRATGDIEVVLPAEVFASTDDQGKTVTFQVSILNYNVPVAITPPQSILIDFDPGDYFYNLIYGDAGNDKLPGTPEPDEIAGLGGDDELLGRAEADRLLGGPGDDRLVGATGDDILLGSRGKDTLVGGPGADDLRCGKGRDQARKVGPEDNTTGCERVKRL
jgi:Ca2+-binding RTX toxin-like protein